MITDGSYPQSRLSTDVELLQVRVKGRSLTLVELKQLLKGRGSAMLLILLALPFCFIAIPGLSTPFGIAICLIGGCLVMGREPWLPRFILRRRLSRFPARRAGDAAINRFGHRYRQSRINVAITHSVLEQHSSLGSSASSDRNDGERRLVRVTWPFNCDSYVGFYWSDFCVCLDASKGFWIFF